MADISKIRLPGEELAYDLKDGFAREACAGLSAQLSGALSSKADVSSIPLSTSQLINDSSFISSH